MRARAGSGRAASRARERRTEGVLPETAAFSSTYGTLVNVSVLTWTAVFTRSACCTLEKIFRASFDILNETFK